MGFDIGFDVEESWPRHAEWEISQISSHSGEPLPEGVIDSADFALSPGEVLPPLEATRQWRNDGLYRLVVHVTDFAGNRGTSPGFDFEVSMKTPEQVTFRAPNHNDDWRSEEQVAGERPRWKVLLRVYDPNEVKHVHCTLKSAGDDEFKPEPLGMHLAFHSRSEDDQWSNGIWSQWVGFFELSEDWSQRQVQFDVRTTNEDVAEFDLDSEQTYKFAPDQTYKLPLIKEYFPEVPARLGVESSGTQLSEMRLVRASDTDNYSLFGRGFADEIRSLMEAGLSAEAFAPGQMRFSDLVYTGVEIGNYYLDEREVSRADYAEFLRSTETTPAEWPANGPDAERRRELREKLEGFTLEDLLLPITDITWDEASAFASWAGKRLPTVLEWEFAVRNGDEYRAYPSARQTWGAHRREADADRDYSRDADGDPVDILPAHKVRDAVTDDNGVTVTDENGVTRGSNVSHHGLLNLTGNVREWTQTPFLVHPPYTGEHKEQFLDDGEQLLLGTESPNRYFAVGGSWQGRSYQHFFSYFDWTRVERRRDLGFRCALSAENINGHLDGESDSGVIYRELPQESDSGALHHDD